MNAIFFISWTKRHATVMQRTNDGDLVVVSEFRADSDNKFRALVQNEIRIFGRVKVRTTA